MAQVSSPNAAIQNGTPQMVFRFEWDDTFMGCLFMEFDRLTSTATTRHERRGLGNRINGMKVHIGEIGFGGTR
jgi:hypothetical protein